MLDLGAQLLEIAKIVLVLKAVPVSSWYWAAKSSGLTGCVALRATLSARDERQPLDAPALLASRVEVARDGS